MSNTIANFSQESVNNAMVDYIPAHVSVEGKTATEKRLSIVAKADASVVSFAATMGGKVGKEARSGLQADAIRKVSVHAARGNYTPLAQMLSLITAEPVSISNRSSFESLVDRYQPMLDQLEVNGKMYSTSGKLSSKAATLTACIAVVEDVQDYVTLMFAEQAKHDGAE